MKTYIIPQIDRRGSTKGTTLFDFLPEVLVVADFVLRGIEAFIAGHEFTSAFEEIDDRVGIHAVGGTGAEPGVCSETFDDGLDERFTAEASIGFQHHVHDFVGVYVFHIWVRPVSLV